MPTSEISVVETEEGNPCHTVIWTCPVEEEVVHHEPVSIGIEDPLDRKNPDHTGPVADVGSVIAVDAKARDVHRKPESDRHEKNLEGNTHDDPPVDTPVKSHEVVFWP